MQRVTEIQTMIQAVTRIGQDATKLYEAALANEHDCADELYLVRSALLDAYRNLTKVHTDLQVDLAQRKLRSERIAAIPSTLPSGLPSGLQGTVVADVEIEPQPLATQAQIAAEQELRADHPQFA